MNVNPQVSVKAKRDTLLTKFALLLSGLGLVLLVIEIGRFWSGNNLGGSSLNSNSEAYRLIVIFGLIFGGFLVYGRLGLVGKIISELVWLLVLSYIVVWFRTQENFGGRQLIIAAIFAVAFIAVSVMFVSVLFKLWTGNRGIGPPTYLNRAPR